MSSYQVTGTFAQRLHSISEFVERVHQELDEFKGAYRASELEIQSDPPFWHHTFLELDDTLRNLISSVQSCQNVVSSLVDPPTAPTPSLNITDSVYSTRRRPPSTPLPTSDPFLVQPPTPAVSTATPSTSSRQHGPTPPETLVPGVTVALRSGNDIFLAEFIELIHPPEPRGPIKCKDLDPEAKPGTLLFGDAAVALDEELYSKMRNLRQGRKVMAIYPECTAFYEGTVEKGPKKSDDFVVVNFDGNASISVPLNRVYPFIRLPAPSQAVVTEHQPMAS
ncbi:hypothetical protein RCL1_002868 [Eukaryota sp. TZLM3-RCL]